MKPRNLVATLLTLAVVAGTAGCSAWARRDSGISYVPWDETKLTANDRMALAAQAIDMAMDDFSFSNNDRVPGPDALVATLTRGGWLDDKRLPRNPFLKDRSPIHIVSLYVPDEDPLLDGTSQLPTPPALFRKYLAVDRPGVVLVLVNRDRTRCRVIGVGQQGGRSTIVYGPDAMIDPGVKQSLVIGR